MATINKYVVSGILGIYIVKNIGVVFSFINSIILARFLNAEEFGMYSFVIEMMLLVSIPISKGAADLMTREIAKYKYLKKDYLIKSVISWSDKFVLLSLLCIILFVSVVSTMLNNNFEVRYAIFLALPLIIFYGLLENSLGMLRGFKCVVQSYFANDIVRQGTIMILSLITYIKFEKYFNTELAIIITVFATLVALIISRLFLNTITMKISAEAVANKKEKIKWKKEVLPFISLGFLVVINTKIGFMLVSLFRPIEDVGFFKIALTAASLISFLLIAVSSTISPIISEYYDNNKKKELQKILKKVVRVIFFAGLLITAAYIVFGKFFIEICYGKEYMSAYKPLIILAIGQLINIAAGPVGYTLSMTGHQRDTVKGQLIGATSNVLFSLILIPLLGIVGASISITVSLIIWNLYLLHFLKCKTGLSTAIW